MSERPNILFLHGDGAGRFVDLFGAGAPTPNLRRLANDGVSFRRAYCAAPSCSPSRAALYTGRLPSACGMNGLAHLGWWFADESETLPVRLREAGYTTAVAGRVDFTQLPFDRALVGEGRGPDGDAETAELARGFLREPHDAPFFLSVGLGAPKGRQKLSDDEIAARADERFLRAPGCADTAETRYDTARQYAATTRMDELFGGLLDELEAQGLAESTLVIATTDHGPPWPHMKGDATEAGLGVFLVMRGPGGFAGGWVCDALVSQTDLHPTVCELAGLEAGKGLDGRSLLPLARGESESIRTEVAGELTYHFTYDPVRTIRTQRYRYTRRFAPSRDAQIANMEKNALKDAVWAAGLEALPVEAEALYDHALDPEERCNRIDDPAYATATSEMRGRLERAMADGADPLRHGPVALPADGKVHDPADPMRRAKGALPADEWNGRLHARRPGAGV